MNFYFTKLRFKKRHLKLDKIDIRELPFSVNSFRLFSHIFCLNLERKVPFLPPLWIFSSSKAALKLHLNILCLQKFIFGIPVARNIRDEWINTRQNFKRKVNELLENRLGALGRCTKCKTEIKMLYVCKNSSFSYLGTQLVLIRYLSKNRFFI